MSRSTTACCAWSRRRRPRSFICRLSSARRCGTRMRAWRFPIFRWCSAGCSRPSGRRRSRFTTRIGSARSSSRSRSPRRSATSGITTRGAPELRRPALTLACLVLVQVTLGAFVIWSQKNVAINTAHVVVGALTLATSLVLTLRSHRVRFGERRRRRARAPASRAPPRPIGCPRVKNVDAGVPRRLVRALRTSRASRRRLSRAHQTAPELARRRHRRHRLLPRRRRESASTRA